MNNNKVKNYAPVAIFCYKRLDHLKHCVNSLLNNNEINNSEVYFFCDNSKSEEDSEAVTKVREFVKSIKHPKKNIILRNKNFGLQKNLVSGISEVLENHNTVIVVEDDLILSKNFLRYMNDSLKNFKDSNDVVSIHGYCYPDIKIQDNYFFLKGADCWGWATWKEKWSLYESNAMKLLVKLLLSPHKIYDFNFSIYGPYLKMLINTCMGNNNSWAIKWYTSAFLEGKLTLYPKHSFVFNSGLDNSGDHCNNTSNYDTNISEDYIQVENINIMENSEARKEFNKFFKNLAYNKLKS